MQIYPRNSWCVFVYNIRASFQSFNVRKEPKLERQNWDFPNAGRRNWVSKRADIASTHKILESALLQAPDDWTPQSSVLSPQISVLSPQSSVLSPQSSDLSPPTRQSPLPLDSQNKDEHSKIHLKMPPSLSHASRSRGSYFYTNSPKCPNGIY